MTDDDSNSQIDFVDGLTTSISVQTEPVVLYPKFVVFEKDGKEVGSCDARFDLTNCPPELHYLVMNILRGNRMVLPGEERIRASDEWRAQQEARKVMPWWKRLFS